METLKIALVDLSGTFGGGQVALYNKAYSLSKRGHEIHIISGMKNIPRRFSEFSFSHCSFYDFSGYSNLFQIREVKGKAENYISRLHRTHKFDVIDAQGISGIMIPSHLRELLVVTIHGNIIYRGLSLLKFSYKSPEMRLAVLKSPKNFAKEIFGHFFYGNLERIACERAKIVVTLTPTESSYIWKYYSICNEKIRIVPNAITIQEENEFNVISVPEDKRAILSVGALELIKGTPILAKAIEYILESTEDVVYISVGDGPLMGFISKVASRFPEKMIILPHVTTGLTSLYKQAVLLVHGSLFEAFGLVIGEAMFLGKPIVAFRLASIPDLIIDKVTGLLAKPACPRDLAIKTINLLEDEKAIQTMGFNAKKRIIEISSPHVVGKKLEDVFKEV